VLLAGRARRVELLASAIEGLGVKELADLQRGAQLLRELIDSMRRAL
jgi:hypothetical protein